MVIFASNGQCRCTTSFNGFALSLMAASEFQADRIFNAPPAGG
jgi:hypothetical protein